VRPPPTSASTRLRAAQHRSPLPQPSLQPLSKVPSQILGPTHRAPRNSPSRFFLCGTGMGTFSNRHPHRESLPEPNRLSSLTKPFPNLRYLWRTRSFQPLLPCGQDHAFHTDSLLFTALFNSPVGDVGNTGRLTPTSTSLSKTPDTHSCDLENCAPLQPLPRQPHRKLSHFSSPNG
jgi:hypothetical protein